MQVCEIWDSHSSNYGECCLCIVMPFILLDSFRGTWCVHHYSHYWGNRFFWNEITFRTFLPDYTASQSRIKQYWSTALLKSSYLSPSGTHRRPNKWMTPLTRFLDSTHHKPHISCGSRASLIYYSWTQQKSVTELLIVPYLRWIFQKSMSITCKKTVHKTDLYYSPCSIIIISSTTAVALPTI